MSVISNTCMVQFRLIGRVWPFRKVHAVMRSLVDRLIKDESLGFEAKASEILMPLATSIDLEIQIDFLDALSYLQMKSIALFQLINESALTAIITASHRNTLLLTTTKKRNRNKLKQLAKVKGSDKKMSKHNRAAHAAQETSQNVSAASSSSSDTNGIGGESSDEIAKAAAARWGASTSLAVSTLFETFKKDYFERELYVLRNSIVDILLDNLSSNPDCLYISTQISIIKFNSGNHSTDLNSPKKKNKAQFGKDSFSTSFSRMDSSGVGEEVDDEEEEDEDKDDFDVDEDEDKLQSLKTDSPKKMNSRSIRPFSSSKKGVVPSSFSSFSTPTNRITNLNSPSRAFKMSAQPSPRSFQPNQFPTTLHKSSNKQQEELNEEVEGCFAAIVPTAIDSLSELLTGVLNQRCLADIFESAENSVRRCSVIVTNANPEGDVYAHSQTPLWSIYIKSCIGFFIVFHVLVLIRLT